MPCNADCPNYKASLGGLFAEAARHGYVTVSEVSKDWDDVELSHEARAIIYTSEGGEVDDAAPHATEALQRALKKLEEK